MTETRERRTVAWGAWGRLAVASLARVIVLTLVGGLFWACAPALIGWKPTTVMSDSMAPRFFAADVVVAAPATPEMLVPNRVLLADDPDHAGRLRLHRMVGVDDRGIITKGDANATEDSTRVKADHVRGVAVLRIPWVGAPVLWAKNGQWPLTILVGLAFVGLVALTTIDRHLRADRTSGEQKSETPAPRAGLRGRLGPAFVLAGTAGAMALTLAVTTGAHAAFAYSISNPTSNWTAAADYACWPTTTAADAPYLYYRFNESATTTNMTDFSGSSRTGVPTRTARVAGTCPSGSATSPSLTFTSTGTTQALSSYVTPTASAAVAADNSMSLEAWFKTTSTTGGKLIGFGNQQSAASTTFDRHLYMTNAGAIIFGVNSTSRVTITSAGGLNNGAWHHVIATLGTTGMRLYIDGTQVASNTSTTTGTSYNGYWRIGYDSLASWGSVPTNYGFTGQLDNVAVYTDTLTATQVTSHYAVGH